MKTAGKLAFSIPTIQREFGGFRDLARSSMVGAGLSGLFSGALSFFFENPWAKLVANGLFLIGSVKVDLPSLDVFAV